MWKVVTNSNSNPLFKLFFYSPISTNNNLSLKIYCENIMKILYVTQFWFLIPYIIFLSFFFLFFFLVFSPPHTNTYPQYLSSLFVWLFVFLVIYRTFLPFSLSLSLSLTHTHTHTNFSPSISHKQILFHTRIDHRQRTKIRVLPTSKNMQLNHHIG